MIPDRLLKILRSCEADKTCQFPPTEIYNEGWMLRLILDAAHELGLQDHPLEFLPGATWFSEALLNSAFLPRRRADTLAEGFTHADGIVGHFEFAASTAAGVQLKKDATQFVVFEAKMFSNLSKGTTRAPLYDQAARNVACMAETIARSGQGIDAFQRVGFFVIAPIKQKRGRAGTNLESCTTVQSIRTAVRNRIAMYEDAPRPEAEYLCTWEQSVVLPLIERMDRAGMLGVLSWEECIDAIGRRNQQIGAQLSEFYRRCLSYGPPAEEAANEPQTAPATV